MLILPRKTVHALEAVLTLACSTEARPMSGREIAEAQGLPPRYLEQLMQRLVRAGILRGVRGPHGGYVLARERRRITVAEICEALAEEAEAGKAGVLARKVVLPLMREVRGQVAERLHAVTLAELCERAKAEGAISRGNGKMDFAI